MGVKTTAPRPTDCEWELTTPSIAVSITLHDSAKVGGDMMHQKLSISEGAEFDGRVR